MSTLPSINWPSDGLIPIVIQDDVSDRVLMLGFMNAEALQSTLDSGEVHFWSRSRQELWHKGASSGHVQRVRSVTINCDLNSLLIRVEQLGAVCHDGFATCYYRDVQPDGSLATNQDRLFDPRDVYGDGMGLAGLTSLWWGAFEWLGDHDLQDVSSTSRLLHDSSTSVTSRVSDELRELAGVLDGTHFHTTQQADLILEASQCAYWVVIAALKSGVSYDQMRPDRALDVAESPATPSTVASMLRSEADARCEITAAAAHRIFHTLALAARALDIDPRMIIEADINDLRNRPYLTEYFAR